MPRRHKPTYFRNRWVSKINGRRETLVIGPDDGPTKAKAEKILHGILAEKVDIPSDAPLLRDVANLYLDMSKRTHYRTTYWDRNRILDGLCVEYPTLRAVELKPYHVDQWLDKMGWKPPGRRNAISSTKAAFNHAVEKGMIEGSAICRMPNPSPLVNKRVLTEDETRKIQEAFTDCFGDVIECLRTTACRPCEVSRVTAENVDLKNGFWIIPPAKHKTGKKTGKARAIPLSPEALRITKRLMRENPTGPIFLNRIGKPWSVRAIVLRFYRLRKRIGLAQGVTAYAFRHTGITKMLETEPPSVVAAVAGHTTLRTLAHYDHIGERKDLMKRAVAGLGKRKGKRKRTG